MPYHHLLFIPEKGTDNLKVGALPSTAFHHSDSGWVNAELFIKWFEFFLKMIPPLRPVLLILDGHASRHSGCGRAGPKKRHPHALPACSHNTYAATVTLQKQSDCFNHSMVTLVADKLKKYW